MFGFFKNKPDKTAPKAAVTPENVFYTDVGMLCVWDYATYQQIGDYEAWESEFVEDIDITRNIKNATFVPLNIQSDGAWKVDLRLHQNNQLSEIEQRYLTVSSQPYLLKTAGKIGLSGMEIVGKNPATNIKTFNLEEGEYVV